VWLLKSWSSGSGFESLLVAIERELVKRFPGVNVIQRAKPSAYSLDDPSLWDEMLENADAFFYAAGPSCSTTHYAVHYTSELERRGLPGAVLCYETLVDDVLNSIEGCGVTTRWSLCPYPLDNVDENDLMALASEALESLLSIVQQDEKRTDFIEPPARPRIACTDTFSAVQEVFFNNGWTDGLPVVPPTEEAVAEMLSGTSLSADRVVVEVMEPEGLQVTVEQVAINAVMAGCTPEALPIVLAAVYAYSKGHPEGPDDFSTPARSTNSFAFMQVVNGPIRHVAGMNSGVNALGPGNRANASIGRALRLAIVNLGGGEVGVNLMPVQGNPAAYSFAFAENEESSPWASLAVSQGFADDENVLTLLTGGWSHVGNFMADGIEYLAKATTSFEFPSGLSVLMSPARAKSLKEEGFDKDMAEEKIWSLATKPARELRRGVFWSALIEPTMRAPLERRRFEWSETFLTAADDELVPVFPRSAVKCVVVGGEVSPMMQGWMMQSAQSVSIDEWR
jgi:hypothetical protein